MVLILIPSDSYSIPTAELTTDDICEVVRITGVSLEDILSQIVDHPRWSGPVLPEELRNAALCVIKQYNNNIHLLSLARGSSGGWTRTSPKSLRLKPADYDALVKDIKAVEALWTELAPLDRWIIGLTWWTTVHTGALSRTVAILRDRYAINLTAPEVEDRFTYWAGMIAINEGWI